MRKSIDLNADLGEDESEAGIARDLAMMDVISSCNVACGGHAGSPENMRRMLAAAGEKQISSGAHPSYPDRANFGRVSLDISHSDLLASLKLQMKAIREAAFQTRTTLRHIKPHGALYNDAQDADELAQTLVELASLEKLPLVGMAATLLEQKAKNDNVPFIAEAFIDRRYTYSSRLVPRIEVGAVIEDEATRLAQAIALASGTRISTNSEKNIRVTAQTLCLHSDSSGALKTAQATRRELEHAGISIEPVSLG